MKTTIYFYSNSGTNGMLMRQGNKAINLGNFAPTGIFDDIPNHPVDLFPSGNSHDDEMHEVVSQLKAAYASVADKHMMYDFDDMLTDYGDDLTIADWEDCAADYEQELYPIATIDGSCGTIEIIDDFAVQEENDLTAAMAEETAAQPMLQL